MFGRLLRDLYDAPEYRYNVLPGGLLLDNYSPSQPHAHLIIKPRSQPTLPIRRSESKRDLDKFQVMLNVKHFRPDEIEVKTIDNYVMIHGKHEEQADEHGFVSREFTRRYELPEDVEPHTVTSSLSQDGVLTIQAPRKVQEPPPQNERIVPITIQQPAVIEAQKQQQQTPEQQAARQQNEEEE